MCGSCGCSVDSGIDEALFSSKVDAVISLSWRIFPWKIALSKRKKVQNTSSDPCSFFVADCWRIQWPPHIPTREPKKSMCNQYFFEHMFIFLLIWHNCHLIQHRKISHIYDFPEIWVYISFSVKSIRPTYFNILYNEYSQIVCTKVEYGLWPLIY